MKIVHIFFVRLKHYLITELRFLISLKLRSSIVKVNFDSISFKLYTNSIFSWIRAKKIKNEARINEDIDQRTLLRKYEVELKKLKQELEQRN
mgnify:CR=1 FL=1